MHKMFHPKTVAVIGVSEKPDNLGRSIVNNLISFNFTGVVYAVGPSGGVFSGRRIYHSVEDIPDAVDLAVILTPARTVPGILRSCGEKGIRRVVIESAGFGEFSDDGQDLERQVKEVAAQYNIRFIGPNCIGVINLANGLSVPFTPLIPNYQRGGLSIVSQSGGVALSYLNLCYSENLGISKMASIGNKLDIDENDLLEYLIEDPETKLIGLYLEGISDGRRLTEIARRSKKPIIIHKSNVGAMANQIACSHTGSLASDDAVLDAVLEQVGIVRIEDNHTLGNYLKILNMPKIKGNRLAVLSRSGGHAIIAADACEKYGFELAQFPRKFYEQIESHFRANVIRLTNPIDLGDLFDLEFYLKILELTLQLDEVDGVVFLLLYMSHTEGEISRKLMERMHALSIKYGKPVAISISTDEAELAAIREKHDYQVFTSPEDAIEGLKLSRVYDYELIRTADSADGTNAPPPTTVATIARAISENRDPLLHEAFDIFADYGLPLVPGAFAANEEEAATKAEGLGFPVACKLVSRDLTHKTDVGGVVLNLDSGRRVAEEVARMRQKIAADYPQSTFDGVYLQPMAAPGLEMILGAKRDKQFGPVVLLGFGGIYVEIFRQSKIMLAPIGREEAKRMIDNLPGREILAGARGLQPSDIDALAEAVQKLSRLITEVEQIAEIDINPLTVYRAGEGCSALDARIILMRDQEVKCR